MAVDNVARGMAAAAMSGGGGSSTLAGLTDVDISNPTNGQTLVYNATSGKWENGESAGGGVYAEYDAVIRLAYNDDTLVAVVEKGDYASLYNKSISGVVFVYAPLILVYEIDGSVTYYRVPTINYLPYDPWEFEIQVSYDNGAPRASVFWSANTIYAVELS
jgi:hypothetical protein